MTADPPLPAALALRNVHKHIGQTRVIQGIDLAVRAGERVALVGPNGAGKSTLFDLLSGRSVPSAGEVLLHGRRIDGKRPHEISRLGLARSFQTSHVFAQLSVFENLRCSLLWSMGVRYSFLRRIEGLDGLNRRAMDWTARIGLAHRHAVPAGQLGYAEQRALEIGITVAGGASVVLLDEPTAGMNAAETQHCTALVREVTQGKTLLIVEHDMEVVFELADRIAVLVQGRLLAFDTPAAVRADARVQQAYRTAQHA